MSAFQIRPVNRDRHYGAFMHAFPDYTMDSSGVTEDHLLHHRMSAIVSMPNDDGMQPFLTATGFSHPVNHVEVREPIDTE